VQVNVGELCDANGECGSNQTLNNCPPFDVYRRINCTTVTASVASTSAMTISDTTTHVGNINCPFYPGWNSGLSHCLNDCHQPEFMRSNPKFEFDSIEECCLLHYEGTASSSCLADSLLAYNNFSTRS
jgi:hypothetical protein